MFLSDNETMPNAIIAWTATPKIECDLVHVGHVLLSGLSARLLVGGYPNRADLLNLSIGISSLQVH
jgi:hypothetical protein